SKSTFEFTLMNPTKLAKPLYTPPFATASHMFWQLRFDPKFVDDGDEYCSVFLGAIPSIQEAENTISAWAKRSKLSAKLFLKNANTGAEIDKYAMTMSNYSAKEHTWGRRKFCRKSILPQDKVILGVEFDKAEIGYIRHTTPLPGEVYPKDLAEAWQGQLNQPEVVDVEFNVDGQIIYASSGILSKRSEYFQRMFGGQWSESTSATKNERPLAEPPASMSSLSLAQDTVMHDANAEPELGNANQMPACEHNYRYRIAVTDFHPATFLEMLRFLYTNKVTFNKTADSPHTSSMELFRIADKYLIEELRHRAKSRIFDDLSVQNAAETLFGTEWKYPELKDHIIKYVVRNIGDVRESDGFKNVMANASTYTNFSEIMLEIFSMVEPAERIANVAV
ncbi:1161_t:CDS:2, partial [Paraglomus occultum]